MFVVANAAARYQPLLTLLGMLQRLDVFARSVSWNLTDSRDSDCSSLVSTIITMSVPAGDGKCVICDSYVRPATLVRICDECNYGSYAGRCTICGGIGISDAYYCKECTLQEKDVRLLLCYFALSVTLPLSA